MNLSSESIQELMGIYTYVLFICLYEYVHMYRIGMCVCAFHVLDSFGRGLAEATSLHAALRRAEQWRLAVRRYERQAGCQSGFTSKSSERST